MTNEEFQNIVLEELKKSKGRSSTNRKRVKKLKRRSEPYRKEIMGLREGQVNIRKRDKSPKRRAGRN